MTTRQAIGDDWDGRIVLAWPALDRLRRLRRTDDVLRLYRWRTLVDTACRQAANDNWADPLPDDGEDDERAAEEAIDEADALLIIRPTVGEITSAVKWRIGDKPKIDLRDPDPKMRAMRKSVGGLSFDGRNRLVSFRVEPGSRLEKPREVHRHRKERKAPPVSKSSAGMWTFADQVEARDEYRRASRRLGLAHVNVLELACGPSTAGEIGETLGRLGKSAERAGVRAIDGALAALASLECGLDALN